MTPVNPQMAAIDMRDAGTVIGLGAGALTVVLFVNYARYLGTVDADYWQNLGYLWAFLAIGIPLMALALRPRNLGRALLAGWAAGTLSYSIPEWMGRASQDSSLEGMPWLVAAGGMLLAAALFVGRREQSTGQSNA